MKPVLTLAFAVVLGSAAYSFAQTTHSEHSQTMNHETHGQVGDFGVVRLTEPGQGAFAALSEIVQLLEADPETDWSRVNLMGLRDHLVDMDRLITHTIVEETELRDGIRTAATGDPFTVATIRRMVPAHSAQLAKDNRWNVSVEETYEGVELTVTSDDPEVVARIKGLGFFGLMASQDHHKEHHMIMARGDNAHDH